MNGKDIIVLVTAAALASCSRQQANQNGQTADQSNVPGEASQPAPASTDLAKVVARKPTAPEGTFEEYPFGTVLRSSIWQKPGWTKTSEKEIFVCWENPEAVPQQYQTAVEDAVKTTWHKVSLLSFTGWKRCTADKQKEDIRIFASDEGPHTKALGRYLDDYPHGMVLNFQFAKWSQSCQRSVDFCARAIAVHEFGHALGFAHEQNRADAPFECQSERQGTNGDWNVTTYDPDSIMNYCNVKWNNNGALSQRDIDAVTTLYGARA